MRRMVCGGRITRDPIFDARVVDVRWREGETVVGSRELIPHPSEFVDLGGVTTMVMDRVFLAIGRELTRGD